MVVVKPSASNAMGPDGCGRESNRNSGDIIESATSDNPE